MTSSFDDRKQAFENKFKLDQDLQFKVNTRAVRLLGLWAAEQLGMSGADAEAYAEEVVDSDFDEPGVQDVIRKLQKDFSAKGMDMTDHHLENRYNVYLEDVKKEMIAS